MGLLSFITSAAGGVILGGLTQTLGSVVGELREWSASKRRIAELTALKEKDIAVGELNAFTAAQSNLFTDYRPPTNAPMAMHWCFTIIECCLRSVRFCLVIFACWFMARIYNSSSPAERALLQPELIAFCFSVGYFWLGARHQARHAKSP